MPSPVFAFDNSYARLPERFYARRAPSPVAAPRLLFVNDALATTLGISAADLASSEGVAVLAGNVVPEGAVPIALAYAGHQFGQFVPQLGDGRAILLGEIVGTDGKRRDVQLKGAGRTPFSRGGDGRAALGPVLREALVSEAMAALGVPTTRTLAAVTTGEPVARETLLPGAILTRVASSHLRVGTFEYFAARGDAEALATLTTYALSRHYPAAMNTANDALSLIEKVVEAQATLVAHWLAIGFVHGVMNTDNTSICGETIDYGPCAFLDTYEPQKVFSSIDRGGRYAFRNQPNIAQWNLARLAEALLGLVDPDEDTAVRLATTKLERFVPLFDAAYLGLMRLKIGLGTAHDEDGRLVSDLLERMAENNVDYTVFFRGLCSSARDPASDEGLAALFDAPLAFHDWAERWRRRLAEEASTPASRADAMKRVNPALIPRNHRIEEVIAGATSRGDLEPFHKLRRALATPYADIADVPELAPLALPPRPEERVIETFCGT